MERRSRRRKCEEGNSEERECSDSGHPPRRVDAGTAAGLNSRYSVLRRCLNEKGSRCKRERAAGTRGRAGEKSRTRGAGRAGEKSRRRRGARGPTCRRLDRACASRRGE